jgi:lipopolysaccharide biosynthesis protein
VDGSVPLARVLAFHLPQFYPVAENDEWWGRGFTEWTATAGARRLFPGHYQPHVPADLGFYDLRVQETRTAQAAMAAEHGVEAFVYWHYWFGGRKILERPVEAVLASGEPDFKFCLGWANQSWTGVWHGAADRTLIAQTYPGADDDRAHFEYLLPFFRDRRYLRVGDCPLFYVFRPEEIPDARAFAERWRGMARSAALPGLYLVAECSDLHGTGIPYGRPEEMGFDAGVHVRLPFRTPAASRLVTRVGQRLGLPEIYRYATTPVARPEPGAAPLFPSIYPNWDNTPRAGRRGLVLAKSAPERFRVHVHDAIARVQHHPAEERFVFVKSWNEWAEGNHLEPDLRYGRGYLRVLAEELGFTEEQ